MRLGMTGGFKTGRGTRKFIMLFAALLLFTGMYFALTRMQPAFETAMDHYANRLVTDTVSKAVSDALAQENGGFSRTDYSGKLTVLDTDTVKINRLRFKIDDLLNERLDGGAGETVYIPLGSLSGFYVLSGLGPKIPVKVSPVSMISAEFDEGFESAGINSVKHKLYLNVGVTVRYAGFLLKSEKNINTAVPIIETVISGEVPEFYGASAAAVEKNDGGLYGGSKEAR